MQVIRFRGFGASGFKMLRVRQGFSFEGVWGLRLWFRAYRVYRVCRVHRVYRVYRVYRLRFRVFRGKVCGVLRAPACNV